METANIADEVCFTCLAQNPTESSTKDIYDTYMNLTFSELPEDVPKKLCSSCYRLLQEVFEFRSVCIASYDWLLKMRQIQLYEKDESDNKINELNTEIIESAVHSTESTGNINKNDIFSIHEEIDIKEEFKLETVAIDYVNEDINTENKITFKSELDTLSDHNENDEDYKWLDENYAVKINAKQVKKVAINKITKINNVANTKRNKTKTEASKCTVVDRRTRSNEKRILIEKHFTVKVLSREEQIQKFNERKYSDNYINGKFKCEKCFKGFMGEESYKNHLFCHTDKIGNIICDICGIHLKSTHTLCTHKRNIHRYILTCKQCPYTTPCSMRAKCHINWHYGIKYKCEYCGKLFRFRASVMMHKRVKHATEHVCVLCGYTFLGETGLKSHLRLKHSDQEAPVNGPKCDECNLTFANEEVLATHMATSQKHGGTRSNHQHYKQENENKLYNAKRQDGPKTCEQCNEVLSSSFMYRRHFYKYHSGSTITQGSYLCFICGKTYDNPRTMDMHFRTHDYGITHKCDLCDSTFTILHKLYEHKYRRHGTRRQRAKNEFSCTQCGKHYSNKYNLLKHETYFHSDSRNEQCDLCEKRLKTINEKKLHIDHVHLKKPYKKRIRSRKIEKTESASENSL